MQSTGSDVTEVEQPGGRGRAVPTGTITFLSAGLEGSPCGDGTARGAREADEAPWRSPVEEAIGHHGGVRVAPPNGDGRVLGAFARASDAVAAVLAAYQALAAKHGGRDFALSVCMALHTGESEWTSGGSYGGDSVRECHRLARIGRGGQALVSAATFALVCERLPEGASLVDLGSHRLGNLGRPERIRQLAHPALPSGFPSLRALDSYSHNLPVQLTPLVGREEAVEEIGHLLAGERLVTLTGSGGVGKTRLALAVAAEGIARFPGGVWLVDLAGVAGDDGVEAAALAALGAHQAPGAALVDLVARALGTEPSLVVLDNCEHLVEGCARFAAALLGANLEARVLATSREPLGVPGEVSWRVPSLRTPPPERVPAVSTLPQYEAVRLFVDRARRARRSFAISEQNAPAVATICRRLDGIPLALELAAASCRQLTAERIAEDLESRFGLLVAGARTGLPHHRTLAASIDWSHDRLDDVESIVFRRLGVFAGGFPIEAAEVIASSPGDVEPVQVLELVSRLVDKSLVSVEEDGRAEPRYRLLESLRAYAIDRLRAAGELDAMRDAHAGWFLGWLEARSTALHLDAVVDRVELLHDNFRAALDSCLDKPAVGLRLLGHLARAWQGCGRPSEAMTAVGRLLTQENATRCGPDWVTAALPASVLVELARGFEDAVDLLVRAERLATELGMSYEANLAHWLSNYDEESCAAASGAARQRGDAYFYPLAQISWIEMQTDSDPEVAAQLDDPELVAACAGSTLLSEYACYIRTQTERAPGNLRRCIETAGSLIDSRSAIILAGGVNMLSGSALLARDETALVRAVEAAERRLGTTSPTCDIARHRLGLLRGEPSRVETVLRGDTANYSPSGLHLLAKEAVDAGAADVAVEAARGQAGRGPYSRAVLASFEATVGGDEDRWHEALRVAAGHGFRLLVVDALEGLAVAATRSESWIECLRLAGAAARLREECEYRWRFGSDGAAVEQALHAARLHLDPDEAERADGEGRALGWREAASYAGRARGERRRPRHGWAALTPTEEKVVVLVAEGLTNPQIGTRLLMSRATVKSHLEHIYAKLGIHSRSELASQAARRP